MKVLFVMRHAGYVRNFESTLRMLCDRGHRVHLAFQGKVRFAQLDPDDIALQFRERYPNFSCGEAPRRVDGWGLLGRELRLGVDYLRYCRPEYRHAPKLRERARREAPEAILARSEHGLTSTAPGRMAMLAWLRLMNRAIPRDPAIDAFLRKVRPDVLAVTPLIEPGSPQSEYVRSARALGIRTAFCVASWDNLTNKGLIHGPVDLVTVWNDAMKREAVELHGVPANRVVITGAAAFDHWFDWRTSVTREAFCARVGLPSDRPYLLYLCSSGFVAPQEAGFIRTWVQRIRQSPFAALRNAGILVRPHPQNSAQWQDVDLRGYGGVVVWPAAGAAPVDEASRTDYFDSMYHSAAVVGVNTTAQIESAILGRRVYTLLAPEFRDTQEGTLHFHHLREVNGGLVRAAADFDEHLAQLDEAVRAPAADDSQCRRFVEAFVRPYGIDVPATPRLVDAVEKLGRAALRPEQEPMWAPMARRRLASRSAELERQSQAVAEAKAARRAAAEARGAKRQAQEAERRARLAEKAREDAERRARRTETEYGQRLQRLEALVADFSELGEVDRRKFLRAVVNSIPPRSFIELYAAARSHKLDYEHAEIYMRVKTDAEEYRLHACAKEPFTIDWIHRRIAAGDVLYDIGANVGAYSLVAAKKPGGGARVFSFEPSYTTVATLCANVILNDAARQVTPIPIALSGSTEMTVFSLGSLEPGSARHALGHAEPEDGPAVYQQPVMMFRLDDVVEWFGLPLPNHIKMDVDGGELAVLAGASRTLASPSLQTMLIEVPTSLSEGVIGVLGRHGLRLNSKISVKNKAGEYAVWYGLFARDANVRPVADATDHVASVFR